MLPPKSCILLLLVWAPLCATQDLETELATAPVVQSSEFLEAAAEAQVPAQSPAEQQVFTAQASGPIAPAGGQPAGALSGRIVFTSAGHGWTHGSSGWFTQRGVTHEMNEDYGNLDQMTMFAFYCFNAGATVVTFRPVGHQPNEVVLDNDSAGVTFSGSWSDSSATVFYGSPGDLPYRFASLSATETATATYTPTIPAAGFYPVYTWVTHGGNRTFQLYRINHTGGQSLVRVPHHMVGSGWVYLGTYYFNAGANTANGSVVISNLQPDPPVGSVVIADAIRFGNGMGDVDRGTGVSTYPREEECSRYWVQRGLGQGQLTSLYDGSGDDQSDNVGTPPRTAKEMNREAAGNMFKRIYLGFHSNAGGGKGCIGLYNNESLFPNTATPNQRRWAEIVSTNLDNTLKSLTVPPLEVAWENNRSSPVYARNDYAFGEINDLSIGGEFDATIIETAFHDDLNNAKLMRDPKVRNWMARACYQAVVRYMNQFDALPLDFIPEPPVNVRALATTNGIAVSWSPPVPLGVSGAAAGYVVYRSTDGYGFGNPVGVSGGGTTSLTITNLAADVDYYFRVAATSAGGESLPSETVGCRRTTNPAAARVLFVNGFDRFDRTLDPRQTPSKQNYKPPGNSGTMDRVIPRMINAFDYVVQHGKAISNFGMPFDSCQNEAIINNQVQLINYAVVIWACGNESTADETFNSTEQSKVAAFLAAGGGLFVSGSEIAWDLDRPSGPTSADRNFLHNQLHAAYAADNSTSYTASPAAGSIFDGRNNVTFDDGTKGIYWVQTPDVITPYGAGASVALNYTSGTGGAAAIQYDGSAGGGRVVYFAFPFETITNTTRRNNYLADILTFLTAPAPPTITAQPQSQTTNQGQNATFTVSASGAAPLSCQWRFNGTNIASATASGHTVTNAQPANAGSYAVVVSNGGGAVTSAVAMLTVRVPPTITMQPQSQTVTQGMDATFSVTATGTAPLNYQWRFNGTNLAGATNSSYTRSSAQAGEGGDYSVLVTNLAGSALSSNALLTVLVPPTIIAHPQSQSVKAGSNATFSVTAAGTAPLLYQWRFNAAPIPDATDSAYTRLNVQTNDSGNYSVSVSNVAGAVVSSNALLTVIPLQPLQFDLISLLPDRRVRLVLSGEPGNYEIEGSSDFTAWVMVVQIALTNDPVEFVDDAATNSWQRFYRAMALP